MGLVLHTVLFVIINVIVGSLLLLSQGTDPIDDAPDVPFEGGDTSVSFSDVEDNTVGMRVSESDMDRASIPSWFKWVYLLISGVWLVAIIIGWVRGQD